MEGLVYQGSDGAGADTGAGVGTGTGADNSNSGVRDEATQDQNAEFMGGSSTASAITASNQKYSDPGLINRASDQDNNSNSNSNNNNKSNMTYTQNITISAEDIKKELENGEFDGAASSGSGSNNNQNAIASFIHKIQLQNEKSNIAYNAAMEKQIIDTHRENNRRLRGYPPLKDGAVAAATAAATGNKHAIIRAESSSSVQSSSVSGDAETQSQSQAQSQSQKLTPTINPEPCTGGKFLITKLRSWRTGYERILSFHETYFTTLDPESKEITNLWYYSQIKNYASLPKEEDCLVIDVSAAPSAPASPTRKGVGVGVGGGNTKLKFRCLPRNRDDVMTSLARCKYLYDRRMVVEGGGEMNMDVASKHRMMKEMQKQNPVFECQRQKTRYNTRARTLLVCAPHGLIEVDAQAGTRALQTYLYKHMRAICFISDESSGVVFYMGGYGTVPVNSIMALGRTNMNGMNGMSSTNGTSMHGDSNNGNSIHSLDSSNGSEAAATCDEKVFFISSTSARQGGSGRSDLVTVLKLKFETLGLPLGFTESVTLQALIERKVQRGNINLVGESLGSFQVKKITQRHGNHNDSNGNIGGQVLRNLVLTRKGYILEYDQAPIDGNNNASQFSAVNCRRLRDIVCLVRHPSNSNNNQESAKDRAFTIEFKDGICRTYYSSECDSVLVNILDATVNLCGNFNATVTNSLSVGYRFSSFENADGGGGGGGGGGTPAKPKPSDAGLFQSDPIEVQCLKRLQSIASNTNSYLHIIISSGGSNEGINPFDEAFAVIETCREFNVNVSLSKIRNLPHDEKLIVNTIHDLWAITSNLMTYERNCSMTRGGGSDTQIDPDQSKEQMSGALCTILQTLYRLMMTPLGYCNTIGDIDAMNVFATKVSQMHNELTLYWTLKCASALLLPRPFATTREIENERANKSEVMRNMPNLANFLVCCEGKDPIPKQTSDLILMVVSNILESMLCSHKETTTPKYFSSLVGTLTESYQALISLLQSSSAVLVQNAALFVHILLIKSIKTASLIKESVLNSGFLLQHFYNAIFSPLEGQRFLSRYLCSLWISGPSDCSEKQLLSRMLPAGFLPYLAMPILSEAEEEQLDEIEKGNCKQYSQTLFDCVTSNGAGTNIIRLRKSVKIISDGNQARSENFRILFHVLEGDHSLPDLIWNQQTREELKKTIESELRSIRDVMNNRAIAWNHQQFTVPYPSLKSEVQVGTVYMRLWLQTGHSFIKSWNDPLRLFELLFRRLLCDLDHNTVVTNMCIQCLERLYTIHASKIGIFPDIMILVRSMVKTRCSETQHRLLSLITALVGGSTDLSDGENNSVVGNAEQLINNECINYLCQFVAWGHLNHDNGSETVAQSLENTPAVWFIAPPGKSPPAPESIKGPFRVNELKALVTKAELLPHSLVGTTLNNDSSETAPENSCIDMHQWIILQDVWQLRWQLLSDLSPPGINSPSKIALMAMKCLSCMVGVHKSIDSRGVPFFPIPFAKRLICEDDAKSCNNDGEIPTLLNSPLSIICQELLCDDAQVVGAAVDLIKGLVDHNQEACAKLWRTGMFFFALAYTDVNFLPIAQLIEKTYMGENQRILDKLLPKGLLKILANHGAEKFTDVFLGSYDTPEVIWSVEMRDNLIKMINEHLGDLPKRLRENTTEKYRYCPIPKISYKMLEDETFCRDYYLENLCDEGRFPNWPIAEPVELFQACLEKWEEITLQSQEINENVLENARKLIGVTLEYDEKELRAAYRKVAQKCYSCESSNSKEMYLKINQAYDCLTQNIKERETSQVSSCKPSPIEEDDVKGLSISCAEMKRMHLLLKAQLIICKRHPDELGEYKYPSYKLLLSCLNFPSFAETNLKREDILNSCLLRENRWNFVRTAVDLIFNTCLVSPLNAEELIKENGLVFLESMLDFYMQALSFLEPESEESQCNGITEIVIHIVHTISGVVYFESGRSAILMLKYPHRFSSNWRKCIDLRFLRQHLLGCNMLKRYALEGLASMSKNEELQNLLLGSHVTWPLLSSMLAYDPILETSSTVHENFEATISPTEINFQAFLATRALGMLCGVMTDELSTTTNGIACNAMKKLLTPPLARMLANNQSGGLLETLNLSVENPSRLWDGTMREELVAFVNETEIKSQNKEFQDVKRALEVCDEFEYSNLANEVNIGGIYIRIFNKMEIREAVRDLPDSSHFARSLLQFVGRSVQKSTQTVDEGNSDDDVNVTMEEENHWFPISDNRFIMAVRSILHLVQLDGIVDDVICEREGIQVLLSLFELPQENEAFSLGHDILLLMGPKKTFADSIGNFGAALRKLLSMLEFDIDNSSAEENIVKWQQQKWFILESLASSSTLVSSTLVASSAWLELLGIIVGYSKFTKQLVGRQGAAKTLSRLLWDPSSSSAVGGLLQRFLPLAMLNIFKEKGPDCMLETFDSDCETPELIWNSSLREELRAAITEQLDHVVSADDFAHSLNSFSLDSMFSVKYKELDGEIFIGGVYVEHFIKDPTFQLRDPNGFLEMLLAQWSQSLELIVNDAPQNNTSSTVVPGQDLLETVTSACTALCERPHLSMKLASWGYMKRAVAFIHRLAAKNLLGNPLMCIIKLLNVGATERVNVEEIIHACDSDGKNGIVDGIMKCVGSLNLHPDSALLLMTLKSIIKDALGDIEKCETVSNNHAMTDTLYEIAPSPAPGTEPVQKMKKLDGGGDPLSMLLGGGDPSPAPISKTPARTVKPVRSQRGAISRGQTSTANTIQKPAKSQTAVSKANMIYSNTGGTVNGPAKSQNVVTAARSQPQTTAKSQSNLKSDFQKQTSQTQNPTSNRNFVNPSPNASRRAPAPNTNKPVTQNSTQYKHALPKNHRGVRPIRNQPGPMARTRQEINNPLQNASLQNNMTNTNYQAQNVHPVSFQNSAVSTYNQHGMMSERNQIGLATPQFQTQTQYSTPNIPVQNNTIQTNFQHNNGITNSVSSSSQVHYRPSPVYNQNFVPHNNVQQNAAPSYQNQHVTSQPPMAASTVGPPQPVGPPQSHFVASRTFSQSAQPVISNGPSNFGQHHEQTPVPNMTTFTNQGQIPSKKSFQQGTGQSHLSTTTSDVRINSPINHDPMVIAEEKITSSNGAPGSARGRNILLSSVLKCGLIQFLVNNVLENSTAQSVSEPDLLKTNAVGIIQLLLMDPGYGLMFQLTLDKIPEWKKHQV